MHGMYSVFIWYLSVDVSACLLFLFLFLFSSNISLLHA